MAKKVVASLRKGGKDRTKVIKMVKSAKTGSYTFREETVPNELVKEWLSNTK